MELQLLSPFLTKDRWFRLATWSFASKLRTTQEKRSEIGKGKERIEKGTPACWSNPAQSGAVAVAFAVDCSASNSPPVWTNQLIIPSKFELQAKQACRLTGCTAAVAAFCCWLHQLSWSSHCHHHSGTGILLAEVNVSFRADSKGGRSCSTLDRIPFQHCVHSPMHHLKPKRIPLICLRVTFFLVQDRCLACRSEF